MNFIDKFIEYVNPDAGLKRAARRAALQELRGFQAASNGRRTADMRATGADANAENEYALSTLRNRSRQQVRDNVYARRTVQAISNNIVGTGIIPAVPDAPRTVEKRLMRLWKDWATKSRCDVNGQLTFNGIQKLVMKTVVMSGECLVVRRRVNDLVMPIKLLVLEPDYIDTNKSTYYKDTGNYIIHGVEFSQFGERVAYWLYKQHPGGTTGYNIESVRVPAADVCHVYAIERPGQVRGIPWMHASMIRMKDFDDYEDAELVRQKIAACFSVFVQDSDPDAVVANKEEADLASRVEPGIIEVLPPGKTVTFASPPTTNGYEAYSRKILQGISAGVGITYEMLTGDYSNVNFSSGRMGWLEVQRNFGDVQDNMMIPMLCDRVWDWFMEGAIIVGATRTVISATWTPPRREMIDPVKETQAINLQVRNGFLSFREAVRQLGYDPDDLLEEIKKHNEMLDSMGIVLDSDPRVGQSPVMTDPEEDPDAKSEDTEDDSADGEQDGSTAGQKKSTKSDPKKPATSAGGKGAAGGNSSGEAGTMSGAKSLKELVDAFGAGVRAGTITPTLEDEQYIRKLMELPEVNDAIKSAWNEDGGFRRPITLKVGDTEGDPAGDGATA